MPAVQSIAVAHKKQCSGSINGVKREIKEFHRRCLGPQAEEEIHEPNQNMISST